MSSFRADGGTAMGTWLTMAARVFASVPGASQKHAILLTDGENQHETPEALTAADRRRTGAGSSATAAASAPTGRSTEVRRIAQALLGTVDIIPRAEPDGRAEFEKLMRTAMGRGVADADLRVWAPQGAQVLFVRQVVADGRGPHRAAYGGQRR